MLGKDEVLDGRGRGLRGRAAASDKEPRLPLRPDVVAEEVMLLLDLIDMDNCPFATRATHEIEALAEDMNRNGQINAIIVRPNESGRYDPVCGHGRVLGAHLNCWTAIRTIIRPELTVPEAHRVAWHDNYARSIVKPLDRIWTVAKLLRAGHNKREIAALLDVDEATVTRDAGYLDLPEHVRLSVGKDGFSLTHAVLLVAPLRKNPRRDVRKLLEQFRADPCDAAAFSLRVKRLFAGSRKPQAKGLRLSSNGLTIRFDRLDVDTLDAPSAEALRARVGELQKLLAQWDKAQAVAQSESARKKR